MVSFVLYVASCRRKQEMRWYVGIAGVRQGQTPHAALLGRRAWHLAKPVAWLRSQSDVKHTAVLHTASLGASSILQETGGLCLATQAARALFQTRSTVALSSTAVGRRCRSCDLNSLRLELLACDLTLSEALAEEALHASSMMASKGVQNVRGGPWCRCRLSFEDHREIAEVRKCRGRSALKPLEERYPVGSLAFHLQQRTYRSESVLVSRGLLSQGMKRRSGRSGSSKSSGLSGHQARQRRGLVYGSKGYDAAKYGRQPKAARNKAQRTFRARASSRRRDFGTESGARAPTHPRGLHIQPGCLPCCLEASFLAQAFLKQYVQTPSWTSRRLACASWEVVRFVVAASRVRLRVGCRRSVGRVGWPASGLGDGWVRQVRPEPNLHS